MSHTEYQEGTLEQVRQAVAVIKDTDLAGVPAEQALELDSISRISLIAELENVFQIEISDTDVTPEMFDSLSTLATMVEAKLP